MSLDYLSRPPFFLFDVERIVVGLDLSIFEVLATSSQEFGI
jgi:hypothetical protein